MSEIAGVAAGGSNQSSGEVGQSNYPQLSQYSPSQYEATIANYNNYPVSEEVQNASRAYGLLPPTNLFLYMTKAQMQNFSKFIKEANDKGQKFKDWQDFEKSFYASSYSSGVPKDALYKGLVMDFATFSGIQVDDSLNVIGGDWSLINPPINLKDPSSPNNPFTQMFKKFLSEYRPSGSFLSADPLGFIDNFQHKVMGYGSSNIVAITDNSYTDPSSNNPNAFSKNQSFEAIYKMYVRNPSDEDFQKRLNEFNQAQVKQKGYFNPSESVGDWTAALKADPGVVDSTKNLKTYDISVLNSLMALIIKIIGTLQDIAMTQSDVVKNLTEDISVYTTLKTQVPVFLKDGDKGFWSGSKTNQSQMRDSFNSILAGNWTQLINAFNDTKQDQVKQAQGYVSNTANNVNQQIDLVTALIQMLKDVVSAILRK